VIAAISAIRAIGKRFEACKKPLAMRNAGRMPFAAPFETQDKQGKQALRKDSKATAKTTSSPAK